ncbi:hypothetical protein LINPERPRIM_LOCUS27594 [Linum perenne]
MIWRITMSITMTLTTNFSPLCNYNQCKKLNDSTMAQSRVGQSRHQFTFSVIDGGSIQRSQFTFLVIDGGSIQRSQFTFWVIED